MYVIDQDPGVVIPEIKPTDCIISYSVDEYSVRYISFNIIDRGFHHRFHGVPGHDLTSLQTWMDVSGRTLMELICNEYNQLWRTLNVESGNNANIKYLVIRNKQDLEEAIREYNIPWIITNEILIRFEFEVT